MDIVILMDITKEIVMLMDIILRTNPIRLLVRLLDYHFTNPVALDTMFSSVFHDNLPFYYNTKY